MDFCGQLAETGVGDRGARGWGGAGGWVPGLFQTEMFFTRNIICKV